MTHAESVNTKPFGQDSVYLGVLSWGIAQVLPVIDSPVAHAITEVASESRVKLKAAKDERIKAVIPKIVKISLELVVFFVVEYDIKIGSVPIVLP